MEGAALAANRKHESEIVMAWHIAAFGAAAQAGKLKKLDQYLTLTKPKPKQQTPAEMLEVLREFKERGVPMDFKQVN